MSARPILKHSRVSWCRPWAARSRSPSAFCAAKARVVLDALPDYIKVEASGNIIKNVKSVVVPNTGGDARRTSGRDAEAVVAVRVYVLSVNFVDPPAYFMAVAGDIGGHANNTPIVVQKLRKIVTTCATSAAWS